jgi:glyoxylase-like metal-dependent hydrolase (beta-lactamase superfamily II)
MRLTEDVHLIGGSSVNGFGLSGGMDSHIYVLDGGSSLALIDCGMAEGDSIERIVHHMAEGGLDPDRLGSFPCRDG